MGVTIDEDDVPIQEVSINILEKRRRQRISAALTIPIMTIATVAVFSFVDKTFFIINVLIFILVFYVAALSLDLEVGSVGLPNFGKVGFIAIGAYGFALTFSAGQRFLENPATGLVDNPALLVLVLIIAILVPLFIAAIFGFALAIPTVKLRADYFAIMTIAGAEVIRFLLQNESRYLWQPTPFAPPQQLISNQVKTILVTSPPFNTKFDFPVLQIPDFIGSLIAPLFGWGPAGPYNFTFGTIFGWQIFLFILFSLIAYGVYWFVEQLRKAPYGRTLRAIRDDDITVISVGKDVSRFRSQITIISAIIAAIAGILFAMTFSSFEHRNFVPALTFQLFIFIIIGGLGNSRGALVGTALVITYLNTASAQTVRQVFALNLGPNTVISFAGIDINIIGEIFTLLQINMIINPDNSKFVILGSILILFLIFMPSGLIPEPKTDNEKYMGLLTADERKASDIAIAQRQSTAEQERIKSESEKSSDSGENT